MNNWNPCDLIFVKWDAIVKFDEKEENTARSVLIFQPNVAKKKRIA